MQFMVRASLIGHGLFKVLQTWKTEITSLGGTRLCYRGTGPQWTLTAWLPTFHTLSVLKIWLLLELKIRLERPRSRLVQLLSFP